jgi:hypothetical protein
MALVMARLARNVTGGIALLIIRVLPYADMAAALVVLVA